VSGGIISKSYFPPNIDEYFYLLGLKDDGTGYKKVVK
jgi:hypothetical protein